MIERRLIRQWIEAMPDDSSAPDYDAQCAAAARAFLAAVKAEAKAGRITWRRYEFWRKWVRDATQEAI